MAMSDQQKADLLKRLQAELRDAKAAQAIRARESELRSLERHNKATRKHR